MSRYIIIGAGAVGASLAAAFQLSGIDYALVGRGAQIRHILAHGLTWQRPDQSHNLRLNAFDEASPPELRAGDILILTVKSQDVEAATAFWARQPLAGGAGFAGQVLPVITLQNGIAAEPIAARRFTTVYGASLLTPARFTETGTVVAGGAPQIGSLIFGLWPKGADPGAERIAADLTRAGYLAEVTGDVTRWKAAKLVYNVRNAVEVFAARPEEAAAFGDQLADEARAALAAAGYGLADPSERRVSLAGWGNAEGSGIRPGQQSTWQSLVRGVPSEIDYLNGEIALLGRIHNVPTPLNSTIHAAVAQASLTRAAPGQTALATIAAPHLQKSA